METFLIEYPGPDGRYADQVEALDWEHAQRLEDERGRGGEVIGRHVLTIAKEGMTHADADRLCQDLANSYDLG